MKLYQEPAGLRFIEKCCACGKPTRLWLDNGRKPMCAACAVKIDGEKPEIVQGT